MFVISALTGALYAAVRGINEMVSKVNNTVLNQTVSTSSFSIIFNEFGSSVEGKALYVVVTVIKNIGLIIIMIVVNSFLVVEMNKYYQKKAKLVKKVRALFI